MTGRSDRDNPFDPRLIAAVVAVGVVAFIALWALVALGPQLSGGPSPYYELRELLYSKNSAPIGTDASTNYERYNNPDVDKLFEQYATADDAGQVSIVKQIESYMLKDVPFIPTTESVDWYQYNTTDLQGWPTQDDPYAQPAPWNYPDDEQVLLHLYSKSAQ